MNDDLLSVISGQQINADTIERTATAEPSSSISTVLSGDTLEPYPGITIYINHLYIDDGGYLYWTTGDGDLFILSET